MKYCEITESHSEMGFNIDAYHGTNKDFDTFNNNHSGSGSREGPLGFWFTDNPKTASDFSDFTSRGYYEGGSVIPVKLKIKHPLIIKSYDDIMDIIDKFTKFRRPDYKVSGRQIRMKNDEVNYEAARDWLKSQGYDGIILPNTLTDSPDGKTSITQYVVFEPNQIRSRFAKFDPTKKDSEKLNDSIIY